MLKRSISLCSNLLRWQTVAEGEVLLVDAPCRKNPGWRDQHDPDEQDCSRRDKLQYWMYFFLWFCSYFFLWFCSYFFIVWSKNITLLIYIVQNQFVDRKIIFVGGKIIFKNSIVQVKNVTHSQPAKCESKTWLTPGPERPFRCLELTASRQCASQKRDWRGVLRVKNVTDAGSRTTF